MPVKNHLASIKCKKTLGGRGFASYRAGGAYSAPKTP